MGNIPKWLIYSLLFLLLVFFGVFWYFSPKKPLNTVSENQPIEVPTPTPYSSPRPLSEFPKVSSDSREITGVLENGCTTELLAITVGGTKYQFKASDSIKNIFLGKEVIADISIDILKDNCGTTVKLGSIWGKDNPDQVYVLGGTICLPAPVVLDERDCWIGLKSQSGDYYTLDSVPNVIPKNPTVKISNLDLLLISGKLTLPSQKDYFGQKGEIAVSDIELLVRDAYK